ncbi:MAG: TIGR04551 family protein [Polyangiaceae bacterium]|nr:TIGR04551 family protein [Polyangiaceae bacterium]MCB9608687.1 TIGR04551 family protein [Polyangiaceae bacterium]
MHAPTHRVSRFGKASLLSLVAALGWFALDAAMLPAVATAQPKPPTAGATDGDEDDADETDPKADADDADEGDDVGDDGDAQPGQDAPAAPAPSPLSVFPRPQGDASALRAQGSQRPTAKTKPKASAGPDGEEVYAEDWWSHARPVLELHGYYRLRAELFHNFSLGRIDQPNFAMWPMPIDNHYVTTSNEYGPALCTAEESPESSGGTSTDATYPCKNKTQAGANMRFRLNPELHISDNLRIMSQVDLLDNLVLGSTPNGYAVDSTGGVYQRSGYAPLGAFDNTQEPPSAGVNSLRDSIRVKRVWGEYLTPVGMLRFGRMPSQWGLGISANAGDGYDDDYQSTSDRIMFLTGLKSIDLYLAGAWDFTNEGATSETLGNPEGQPYDLGQLDDVDQYVFVLVRKTNPELQKLQLAQGKLVLNGGAYVVHRRQVLANDLSGTTPNVNALDRSADERANSGFVRRGAVTWIPDFWVQLLYKKFRFEGELVTIQGDIDSNQAADGGSAQSINMWGLATELEQKLVEDRLRLQFKFGWASGDPDVKGISPIAKGLQPQFGDDTISTFRFHPNYKIDLILNRNILSRVQGSYYFRPSVDYDFMRKPSGQKLGGGAAVIWTRASEFVQTPGHARDLGVELDLKLYFQSKDGALNDDPDKMGGFYTMLEWGVLFPLAGLGYQELEADTLRDSLQNSGAADTSTAQALRWYMGIMF